jgi:hypothetical protein
MNSRSNTHRLAAVSVAIIIISGTALATGPRQQRAVPAPGPFFHPLNSVVEMVVRGNDVGSGTIIQKRVDNDQIGWFKVLTADHVVRGETDIRIDIGTGGQAAQTRVGTATSSWFNSMSPAGVRGKDLAMVWVRVGNLNTDQAAFNLWQNVTPLSVTNFGADFDPANPTVVPRTNFTEYGYGNTGDFVNGGLSTIVSDSERRFQNNQIERWVHFNTPNYDYRAVQWDFNVPAAAGFFAAEGLSYAGDSGGPYMTSSNIAFNVGAFRNNVNELADGSGNNIPAWPGGNMTAFQDSIAVVHAFGNSGGRLNPFNTSNGGGVPMTADVRAWITHNCQIVPTPGASALLTLGIFTIARRRRA